MFTQVDLDLLDGLIVHLSGLNVCRNWVGKVSKLSHVRGRCDINAFGMIVERWVSGSE